MSKGRHNHPNDAGSGSGGGGGYSSPHMRGVGLGILVMGVSPAAVFWLWATIGYQGPDYSNRLMEQQQSRLREMYGLPPEPPVSPELLEVPPSLRNITSSTTDTITAGGDDDNDNNDS